MNVLPLILLFLATPEADAPATAPAATQRTVLVELFTSQGCSSCPAADAFVGELPKLGFTLDKVVPITFHVSYWDDLGWEDRFATEAHTQRQMAYSQALATKRSPVEKTIHGPYTPQMVVDGRVHFPGSLRETALKEIAEAARRPELIKIARARATLSHKDGRRSVRVSVDTRLIEEGVFDTDRAKIGIFAVLTQGRVETRVSRGENRGSTLREYAVVRVLTGPRLFRSSLRPGNSTRFELQVPDDLPTSDLGVVVFVQELANMRIQAAMALPVVSDRDE